MLACLVKDLLEAVVTLLTSTVESLADAEVKGGTMCTDMHAPTHTASQPHGLFSFFLIHSTSSPTKKNTRASNIRGAQERAWSVVMGSSCTRASQRWRRRPRKLGRQESKPGATARSLTCGVSFSNPPASFPLAPSHRRWEGGSGLTGPGSGRSPPSSVVFMARREPEHHQAGRQR